MGWVKEVKEWRQKYYGGYCNSARQQGYKPLSYEEWIKVGCPKKFKNN
jgi:hypothetical protein